MKISDKLAWIFAAAASVLPQVATAKAPSPSSVWVGTWHLNTGKSKFSSPDASEKAIRASTLLRAAGFQ